MLIVHMQGGVTDSKEGRGGQLPMGVGWPQAATQTAVRVGDILPGNHYNATPFTVGTLQPLQADW